MNIIYQTIGDNEVENANTMLIMKNQIQQLIIRKTPKCNS